MNSASSRRVISCRTVNFSVNLEQHNFVSGRYCPVQVDVSVA